MTTEMSLDGRLLRMQREVEDLLSMPLVVVVRDRLDDIRDQLVDARTLDKLERSRSARGGV